MPHPEHQPEIAFGDTYFDWATVPAYSPLSMVRVLMGHGEANRCLNRQYLIYRTREGKRKFRVSEDHRMGTKVSGGGATAYGFQGKTLSGHTKITNGFCKESTLFSF